MEQKVPGNYRQVFSSADIFQAVKQLAVSIDDWAELAVGDSGESVLAVCVLRGGVFFYTDLVRQIAAPLELCFCRTESYSANAVKQGPKGVKVEIGDLRAEGRTVLIVDDVCDTGLTLLKLHNLFLEQGAKSVRSAVLIQRKVETVVYTPKWSAFQYQGPEWFVGYGLDDSGRMRNLPEVYVIDPNRSV